MIEYSEAVVTGEDGRIMRRTGMLWVPVVAAALVFAAACGDEGGNGGDGGTDTDTDTDTDADTDADGGSDAGEDGVLALGEVVVLEAGEGGAFSFDVTPESGDERYVLQLVSLSRAPATDYAYEVTVDGEALGPPTSAEPIESTGLPLPPDAPPAFWDEAIAAAGAGGAAAGPTKADPPSVGDLMSFEISDSGTTHTTIEAEVMDVSDELVIAFDRTTDPDLTIDPVILDELAANFADVVLPRERIYFGDESDVNEDGHVTVLFSPLVFTATGGVTAYVAPCDLLADGTIGCPYSNEQEMVYVSPPDLLESYMATATAMTEVMAHEFQHAIYFYRKFMLNDVFTADESMYVTEGMSAMAQDLTGFQAGNKFVAGMAIERVNDFSLADVMAYTGGYIDDYDGTYRGAAYLILRYSFDRLGGDSMTPWGEPVDEGGIPFVQAMSNAPLFGFDGLEAAAGMSADALFPDFYTAMLLDDRTSAGEPLTSDPRYLFADPWEDPITGRMHGVTMCFELVGGSDPWIIQGVPIQQGGADAVIRSGGVEYVLVEAAAAGEAIALGASADDGADLDARLVRIQ
jgi:hypothetical protein